MPAYQSVPAPLSLPTHELGFSAPKSTNAEQVAQQWLTGLEIASREHDARSFADLFHKNGFLRDLLVWTSDIRSIRQPNIEQMAMDRLEMTGAHGFAFAETRPALECPFADVTYLVVHFTFSTMMGPSYGVANLVHSDGEWKAFTVFTMLEGLHSHPWRAGAGRPRGTHNGQESYDERRTREREFNDREPETLVIGGGHNGLAVAAQLKALGNDALVVDTFKRVGDNWRLRYSSLSLHDPVYANHLPFIPFPSNWPIFTPAGKLANFLEHYVEILELNVWCESTVDPARTTYNDKSSRWDVTIMRGGLGERTFSVKHIILATGQGGGKPKMPPPFPGQSSFAGRVIHSSQHGTAADWVGKKALVVGACTSAHDICTDFANHGVNVTMLQRSPTFIMSVEHGMGIFVGGLYGEDKQPLDVADRVGESLPKHVAKLVHQRIVPQLAELDKDILVGLKKAGFRTFPGVDGSGFLWLTLDKSGGYYYDTGACQRVIDGKIKVKQGEIASFSGKDVDFKDGSAEQYDVVVFATGYTGFPDVVKGCLGEHWASRFNPVWGLDEEGEIRGNARESNIPQMMFAVGNLSAARITSKLVALQIVSQQMGSFPERYTIQAQRDRGVTNGYH